MNTTDAIAHLTKLGYVVTAPKIPDDAQAFIDMLRRKLKAVEDKFGDAYDRNNAVYFTYDYIKKHWDIGDFGRIQCAVELHAPELNEECVKAKLWRNWR